MRLSYLEDFDSVIPAIQLLSALGWRYLSREEALRLRNGRADQVVLTEVLRPWLEANNRIEVKGESHLFSDANIAEAIRRLTSEPFDGLVRTNEKIYHLLTLGTSLDQTIAGDRKGRSLHYIEWQHPERNQYHVTNEFTVERTRSHETVRCDLVLFVNGIPFVVIECKRRDKDHQAGEKQIEIAISQQLRNQKDDYVPHLFQFAQLLIATSVNDIRYATVGTPRKYWSVWKEEGCHDDVIHAAANLRLPSQVEAQIFAPLEAKEVESFREARDFFTDLWSAGDRLPTNQDRTLWALLRPERLLELVYGYVVFDAGVRKIARYQQYFAVKRTVERVLPLHEGQRQGGVIWHTTGSGKSLTMVMLAKALALHSAIVSPRVIIVSDRVDLDDQIWRTFEACGKSAAKATTGEHLVRLLTEGKASVITTIINKFTTVRGKYGIKDPNPNIFVLVDESHRTNYGTTAAQMRRVFSHACYLGFTGTPLLKSEKSTARKFGGFIHSYTMRNAVEDEAVAPLLYEGRMAILEQNRDAMERWFQRVTAGLSDAQKADLKRKMATKEVVQKAEQRLRMIAFDISAHYRENVQGTGLKAQLAADSRTAAILYRKFLKEYGMVEAEVIMSPPDTRKEHDSTEEEDETCVNAFWKEMMGRFGSEERYLKELIGSFGREDGVEILIVVDKLLTGFDEPRNTVLYIDKGLKEHNILQAIARVNRLATGKEFGYIVDYRGILGELNQAMNTYDKLEGFDAADVDLGGAVIDTHAEVRTLPQRHTDLWDVFKEVRNKRDIEAMEQHLAPEDRRQAFYEALTAYQKTLAVALGTEHFYEDTPAERISAYKEDLKLFRSLRASVQQRFAETIDYSQYEKQIRKVMDSHIQAPDVEVVTELVNIFDVEAFDKEVERRVGAAAKADTIASRLVKTIHEKMDEDPVFYRKFADLVQQAIDDYRSGRISDAEYLRKVADQLATVRQGHEAELPDQLTHYKEARSFYGVVGEVLEGYGPEQAERKQLATEMAIAIDEIIGSLKRRDWHTMEDVMKDMQNAIDDYLFEARDRLGVGLSTADMDVIIERCLSIAKKLAGG
ncbi:HsdR family type I site-specific deoxyribonuclease [Geomonas sp. RF6]|uniref:type I restriction endonuclease subunit R n=1 Tax=Geomonas sp. RF6 TaxID=2897342 RepID=UPI001E542444|nr:HsdR family type I site-specific deoxyribonuclease [Geomonas sp. RF6]UFS72658.1 HsdR family type I site-specific deoxyribonuclease [Geomonas sp. RF6]